MTRALFFLLALGITTARAVFAEPLPPPQNPAAAKPKPPQGPALVAPQNAPAARGLANQPAAQPAKKNAGKLVGKPRAFFAARRQALIDRKQAAKLRMQQFKEARAVEQEKLYQDWHERYLADTPVRVEYYRALARAYEADALAYRAPYFYTQPVFVPIVYAPVVYTPIYQPPIYGSFISWGW